MVDCTADNAVDRLLLMIRPPLPLVRETGGYSIDAGPGLSSFLRHHPSGGPTPTGQPHPSPLPPPTSHSTVVPLVPPIPPPHVFSTALPPPTEASSSGEWDICTGTLPGGLWDPRFFLKIESVQQDVHTYGHYNKTWRCLSYLIYLLEYVNYSIFLFIIFCILV